MPLRPLPERDRDAIHQVVESILSADETPEQTDARHDKERIRAIREQRLAGIVMQATLLGNDTQKAWGRTFTTHYIQSLGDGDLERLIREGMPKE